MSRDQVYDLELEVTGVGGGDITYLDWDRPDVEPAREAAIAANEADAAIVIIQSDRSEGNDLDNMALGSNQEKLVNYVASATENSVVLVNAGGPVRMEWIEFVSSAMHVWYPGQEGGNAIANLLFGSANPSGKLPMTLGETMWDYPADEVSEYPGQEGAVHYNEGVFVGYRYFDEEEIEPLFPFGHGESYTSFKYSGLRVRPRSLNAGTDTLNVSIIVENTGERDGAEIVQLYVSDPDASVDRPPKELKAFQRVELPAGEQTEVELELDASAFEYYDPEDGWTVEAGTFTLRVGSSSRDLRLQRDVTIRRDSRNGDDESDGNNEDGTATTTSTTDSDDDADDNGAAAGGNGKAKMGDDGENGKAKTDDNTGDDDDGSGDEDDEQDDN